MASLSTRLVSFEPGANLTCRRRHERAAGRWNCARAASVPSVDRVRLPRFGILTPDRDNREIKDRMGRERFDGFDDDGIAAKAAS